MRSQYEEADPENGESQSLERYRYRLRLDAKAKVTDEVKVAQGFARVVSDARSTNETLDDGFSTKDARLDYDSEQDVPGLDDDEEKLLQTDLLFKF